MWSGQRRRNNKRSEEREEKSEKGKKTDTKVNGSIWGIRLSGQSLTGPIRCVT